MRVCIVGAGAVGGHLAGRLAAGGAEVSVVARGPVLEAIRAKGLSVTAADWAFTGRLAAAEADPARLGRQDVVFLTVKAPDLPEIAPKLAPLLGDDTAVIFVSNGIPWWYFRDTSSELAAIVRRRMDPGGRIAGAIGFERAVGGVIYSACQVEEPGVVRVRSAVNRLIMGETDGRPAPRLQAVADVLSAGGMVAEISSAIRKVVWDKLVVNMGSGLISILTQRATGHIYSDAVAPDLVRRVSEEVASIARAMGEDVRSDAEARISYGRNSKHRVSMLQDLDSGRKMEIDAQCVVPLEIATQLGLEVPLLNVLVPLVRMRAEEAGLYSRG
jgi:2-dehydropantoate 2-reductase